MIWKQIAAVLSPMRSYGLLAMLSFAGLGFSQTHYSIPFIFPTSGSEPVVIPSSVIPTINGNPIEPGDEIAVFDSIGQCCGFSKWTGNGALSIVAWGDNSITSEQDGFNEGEKIRFRIWDSSAAREATAAVTFGTSPISSKVDSTFNGSSAVVVASLSGVYCTVSDFPAEVRKADFSIVSGNSITYALPHSASIQIDLFGLNGRCVFSMSRTEQPGMHRFSLQNLNLRQACYIVRFCAGSEVREMPVVIGK